MSDEEKAFRARLQKAILEETQEEMRLRRDVILGRAIDRIRAEDGR